MFIAPTIYIHIEIGGNEVRLAHTFKYCAMATIATHSHQIELALIAI